MSTVARSDNASLAPGQLLAMFRQMVLIRRFDETAQKLLLDGRIFGVMHPYIGEEAIAVAVCANLRLQDRIVSNHRGHGHCIAKGADIRRMMAELFGRRTGYCKGKGGSMHIADFDIGMLGANGIVGAGLPIATGSAVAAQMDGGDLVTVCFFGDGATGEGTFHEALNLSSLWKLPVVWVCENNQYGGEIPVEQAIPRADVAAFAHGYDIPGLVVDGNDVLAVYEAAREAIARARSGNGPTLLECKTFRWTIHAQWPFPTPDPRPAAQVAAWKARDPIVAFARLLTEQGILGASEAATLWEEADLAIADAIAFAEASPLPTPEEALEDMFADDAAAR